MQVVLACTLAQGWCAFSLVLVLLCLFGCLAQVFCFIPILHFPGWCDPFASCGVFVVSLALASLAAPFLFQTLYLFPVLTQGIGFAERSCV